jgi:hypothetical protein
MYKLCPNDPVLGEAQSVIRIADGACIPITPDNTDYQAFLLWKSEGNEPLPADTTENT